MIGAKVTCGNEFVSWIGIVIEFAEEFPTVEWMIRIERNREIKIDKFSTCPRWSELKVVEFAPMIDSDWPAK